MKTVDADYLLKILNNKLEMINIWSADSTSAKHSYYMGQKSILNDCIEVINSLGNKNHENN